MSAIMTFTKKLFDPLHPDASLIDIEDIAHALSMLCRANGHFHSFYSVAQHSINCMKEAKARGCSNEVQLACLLHDASEAYISDITRPVKEELPQYRDIEAPLQTMIWEKWLGRQPGSQELIQIYQIDDAILAHEFINLMGVQLCETLPSLQSLPEFSFTGFEQCRDEFLRLFRHLSSGEKEYFAVGIDWMKPVWLAAEINGNTVSLRRHFHISGINNHYLNADAVLIDMPIGLPENTAESDARPDSAVRSILPPRRKSSVFPVPCRQALCKTDYHDASSENERVLGKKLPSQSHGFSKTVKQLDDFLAINPHWQNRLMEGHPELAFHMLNGGKGLKYSKHTDEGIAERVEILRSYNIDPLPLLSGFSPGQYEDVLDALCLAVSAKLGCQNGFDTIPAIPRCDSRGLKMQVVYGKSIEEGE